MKPKILTWLKIARLKFYSITITGYTTGTIISFTKSGIFSITSYLIGLFILLLIEFCAVLINEYYDYETDRINLNRGFFNGGTGILTGNVLKRGDLIPVIRVIPFLIVLLSGILPFFDKGIKEAHILILLFTGLLFGIGYTMPPLKFCYRGVGEIVVAIAHSFYIICCGFFFQIGRTTDPMIIISGMPLFFSVLQGVLLSEIPDIKSDSLAGKKTLAVILGVKFVSFFSLLIIFLALIFLVLLIYPLLFTVNLFYVFTLFLMIHTSFLSAKIICFLYSSNYERKIDGLLLISLSYILWYSIIPMISLLMTKK